MSTINLSPQQVADMLNKNKIILVDVREPQEYLNERIQGALLFPLSTFNPASLPAVDPARPVVFHCGAGVRSAKAVALCEQAGIAHTHHMTGGMGGWKSARLPYLKLDPSTGQVCEMC